MQDGALVVALTLGGIAEGNEFTMISSEGVICFLGRNLQHDYHEGTHEEGSIGQFVRSI